MLGEDGLDQHQPLLLSHLGQLIINLGIEFIFQMPLIKSDSPVFVCKQLDTA
jgi:hypothetical protein